MTGANQVYRVCGAGFSLVGRDKRSPEDRWALAELDGFVVGAVADGMSLPSRSLPSASGAVADEAVAAFVERASRMIEGGVGDPARVVRDAFAAAELAARTMVATMTGAAGGAAFVGACLDGAGTLAVIKGGDCRAFVGGSGGWRPATPSDDADRAGALTQYLGNEVSAEVVVHRAVDRVLLLSDGGWRAGVPASDAAPFALVRDLVARARRAGETDDLTAVALVRTRHVDTSRFERLAPLTFAVAGALFFAAGLVAASLLGGAP